jgi:hypothetical protein
MVGNEGGMPTPRAYTPSSRRKRTNWASITSKARSQPGWQRHAALIAVLYAFLQVERQHPSRDLSLPHVRAIIQEVLTAHFFVTHQRYLTRMLALQDVVRRI